MIASQRENSPAFGFSYEIGFYAFFVQSSQNERIMSESDLAYVRTGPID